MCLVALFYQRYDDAPVIVGANREEYYARGGEPPRVLEESPRVVAGVDPTASGTWLGVNEWGVLIAVTNRTRRVVPQRPRSRGLLARDLLRCASAREAAEQATRELREDHYAGCNVLCVDRRTAVVLHAGDVFEVRELPPGLHLLTANDVNDSRDVRQEFARSWLRRRTPADSEECVLALRALCGLTGHAPMCLRGPDRGTVSSTIIAKREPPGRSTYLHAQGPPDQAPFEDYSHLLYPDVALPIPERA